MKLIPFLASSMMIKKTLNLLIEDKRVIFLGPCQSMKRTGNRSIVLNNFYVELPTWLSLSLPCNEKET